MRVLTLNLKGRQAGWEDRRRVLIDGIARLAPDLIAFQEVIHTAEYGQALDLLGTDSHVAYQSVGLEPEAEHQGVAIASRWPLIAFHELDLHLTPRTAGFPCAALAAEVAAPAPIGPLLLVNHFPSWQPPLERERELQAVAAARWLDELIGGRDLHVVLTGDMDADPDASSIRFWSGRTSLDGMSVCYRDVWEASRAGDPGHTFTPRNALMRARSWPFRRIDYIFVRADDGPTLDIRDARLVFDEPVDGTWASDHFGVVADLEAWEAQG